MPLTRQQRGDLPAEDFAVPGKRKIAIHDADHVRMGWETIGAAAGLTEDERREGRKRIIARAKEFDMDASKMEQGRVAGSWKLDAMALNIDNGGHANKMPFSGVLTFVDRPSDSAPAGSHGRRVTITAECADKALPTLMGMAVNYCAGYDGHDPKAKIGIITSADVVGNEIHVGGFIYAADFPEVAAEIKANKDLLGFSYECREIFTDDPDANPVRITDCVFTGAAILLKAKAAYKHTSLAANAAGELKMDKEVQDAFDGIKKMVTDVVKPLADTVTALAASVEEMKTKPAAIQAKAEAHAKKYDDLAASLVADGMDASTLVRQAAYIRAEGAQGRLVMAFPANLAAAASNQGADVAAIVTEAVKAAVKPLEDKIAASDTVIKDLKASVAKGVNQPERKTLSPHITSLLARSGITLPTAEGEAKVPMAKIDDALKGISLEQRFQIKEGLAAAGVIAE
jgi:hypothetical protein